MHSVKHARGMKSHYLKNINQNIVVILFCSLKKTVLSRTEGKQTRVHLFGYAQITTTLKQYSLLTGLKNHISCLTGKH